MGILDRTCQIAASVGAPFATSASTTAGSAPGDRPVAQPPPVRPSPCAARPGPRDGFRVRDQSPRHRLSATRRHAGLHSVPDAMEDIGLDGETGLLEGLLARHDPPAKAIHSLPVIDPSLHDWPRLKHKFRHMRGGRCLARFPAPALTTLRHLLTRSAADGPVVSTGRPPRSRYCLASPLRAYDTHARDAAAGTDRRQAPGFSAHERGTALVLRPVSAGQRPFPICARGGS